MEKNKEVPAGVVRIKPLEWVCDGAEFMPHWKATSPVGWYSIEEQYNVNLGRYWLTIGVTLSELYRLDTLEEAQDRATSDYETRIRACLAHSSQEPTR